MWFWCAGLVLETRLLLLCERVCHHTRPNHHCLNTVVVLSCAVACTFLLLLPSLAIGSSMQFGSVARLLPLLLASYYLCVVCLDPC